MQAAERLLKQGKTAEAFEQLERLAKAAPSDVLTINRMGDLLARQGRTTEAIGYYFKIATFYTEGGYLPKAIAIYKKIVRLDPKSSISLSRLGELYLKQKLPAEAQRFLSTAAQQYEEGGDHAGARATYEKLVKSDPDNPLHRARLADAMAAGGDNESALAELLNLGDKLQRSGKGRDAETTYRRALKLEPDSADAILGIARALGLQGNTDGAVECLESCLAERLEPQVLSELALVFERAGRSAATESLLRRPGAHVIPDGAVGDLLALAGARGEIGTFWHRLDGVTATWLAQGHGDRVGELLERLSESDEHGHAPALERLERHLRETGQAASADRVLERLVNACRDAGDQVQADAALKRLKTVAPKSALFAVSAASTGNAAPPPAMVVTEFETPAVPLTRSDKEFVTGRLTQAEILEKYSLLDQAQQQVLEVTARFPGHVGAQEKLLTLRRFGDPAAVRDTLVSLAIACRAAGDPASAEEAANEARQIGGIDPRTEEALRRLGLLSELPSAAAPPPSSRPTAVPVRSAVPVSPPRPATRSDAQDSFLIDFDADDETSAVEPAPQVGWPVPEDQAVEVSEDDFASPPSASGPVRAPRPDMLAEIRLHLEQGRSDEAQRDIIALESLGYGSAELDELAARAERMLVQPEAYPTGVDDSDALVLDLDDDDPDSALALSDADDLSTITAALEGDAAESDGPLTTDAGTEQSVEEVFAAFRQAVEDEVGEDPRTHYDLAIGYKEMGLLEEAVTGFEIAAKSADLARDANMMLAVCHRELGDMPRAVEHYRRAATLDCEDPEIRVATHYDLAEVLIQSGDEVAALGELRRVLELDPRYRDVRQRIGDLETRLQT